MIYFFIKFNIENTIQPSTSDEFSSEWERRMSDYEPEYVYMIPVAYKKKEIYYENINKVPAKVKGAYLLDEEKKENIDLFIYAPSGNLVHYASKSFDIFELNLTEAGAYRVVFDNRYSNSDLKITFTMNTGQNPILKKEDLSIADEKLQSILKFMKSYSMSLKMRRNLHTSRFKSKFFIFIQLKIKLESNEANKYFYTFSMFETILLIGLSIWQFYYMRQLVQRK